MQNVGGEQFDYDTFVAAYETDPRVKTMVDNFNQTGISPKTSTKDSSEVPQGNSDSGRDKVAQMAKSATDVGKDL